MLPLEGILILDLTRFLPGAVATMQLASFGAEVIKVEQPGAGDPARNIENCGWLFAETNCGKKSVAINLKDTRGRELLRRLAKHCDVLIENFRPGVMTKLGLAYEGLLALNPGIIYTSLRGYAHAGDDSEMAGHDINYLAMSGVLEAISPPNCKPSVPEIQIADLAGGSAQLVIGILLALQARRRHGLGQRVNVSMLSGMGNLLAVPLAATRRAHRNVIRGNELLSGAYACYNLYEAKDGRWIAVGALEPKFWANLCRHLGCEELIEHQFSPDPKCSEIKNRVAEIFSARTAEEWFEGLRSHDCCVSPVRSLQEAVANGYYDAPDSGIELSHTPAKSRPTCVPATGEHSAEVLGRIGVSESTLDALELAGVVGSVPKRSVNACTSIGDK
jgi:crotonobetainyl-CoA:carnitine CoA-transferase CaiB-like acyl-CoA transferase